MASTITLDRPELPTKEEGANGVQDGVGVQGSATKGGSENIAATGTDGQTTDSISPSPSPGSGSVSLRGTTLNGTSPGPSNAPPLTVPQPKKFSHVNINKKFLEKTSSASSSGPSTSTLVSAKVGSMPQKPTLQTAPSHSRLVTAKLTAGPQPSTVTGPGWSRPSSTNSSVAPTPSATNPKPSPLPASSPSSSAPPPVQFGKIIQPQPRSSDQLSNPKKDGSSKPAWGNARTAGTLSGQSGGVQEEFPTAAEVAQVNTAKLIEKKQAAQAAAAQKQALAAEADAFRGIHLTTGHHWDEDEGDDDNFLENVIDFGDGRQYKIQAAESQQSPHADQEGETSTKGPSTHPPLDQPVSKAERFGDDFDRSWPRNRGSSTFLQRDQQSRGPPSATSSHSPQEGSRVLFNERSNRLEPYSNHRYGAPRDPFISRRDSRSDYSASPTEMRSGRDLPPHTQRQDGPPRSRVFGDRPAFSSSFDNNPRNRDRDPRRDFPSFGRSTSQGGRTRDGPNSLGLSGPPRGEDRPRRLSTGPIGEPGEEGRQLPPHLSGLRPPRSTSSDRRSPLVTTTDLPAAPQSVHSATRSPSLSQATLSPLITESPLQGGSGMPLMDIDEVRRAAMHSAAERARLRRQQEEEEREKEKERARRKAAELESKMKVEKVEKEEEKDKAHTEAQVIEIIQDAVQSASEPPGSTTLEPVPEEPSSAQVLPPIKTAFGRPPSTRGTLRSAQSRRSSFPTPPTNDATSPATDATSWRSKTLPPRPFIQQPSQVAPTVSSAPPAPLLHPELERQLTIQADEEVEVIDFSDHGRLAGVETEPPKPEPQPTEPASISVTERRRPRPLAMDFFEDERTIAQSAKSDEGSWRRKSESEHSSQEAIGEVEVVMRERLPQPPASAPIHSTATSRRRLSVSSDDHSRMVSGPNNSTHTPRSPQAPHYREAPMSALDDTMARIKGALDGMQRPEPPKPPQKWLPPALRPRAPSVHNEDSPVLEVFDVTASDLPRSPKPAWNHFTVKLPAISYTSIPLSRKQIHLSQTQPHVRADIYTWDPPIDGMNRKDFHLNDILFRKPPMNKGQVKYTIALPGNRPSGASSGPVVHLPPRAVSSSPNNAGAFGRRREADGVANWRKPPPSPLKTQTSEEPETPASLDTVSRSPPPEAPVSATVPSTSASDALSPSVSVAPSKARPIHKPVVGSDVAFYRDSRSEQSPAEPKSTVNFIVNSELEEQAPQESAVGSPLVRDTSRSIPATPSTPPFKLAPERPTGSMLFEQGVPTLVNKNENRRIETQPSVAPISPPRVTISAPWPKSPRALSLKDSPSRAPVPEHLKAVWSQTSNKAEPPSINSLERIGDDLAPVPFTISEVKSEDGETPPPTQASGPSRMSLHDVTRAFQQVPTSSMNSNRSAPITSPPTTHRQPVSHLPPPVPNGSVRPAYPGYPPPVVNSPSPTMVYPMPMTPSPIPRQMVVNGAQYGQPMWVQVPNGPPTNGMMRPVAPGYGPQLIPYPPAGSIPMYMQGGVPPQMNGNQGRPPNMPVMSPMMPQAQASLPMYAGSPVLVHSAPVMRVPSGSPYPPPGQPRGQGRGVYDQPPGMLPHSPAIHPQNAYSTIPSNSLDRSTW